MIAIGALFYFVNPIDAIPDIIPLVGFTDDAAIALTAITLLKKDKSITKIIDKLQDEEKSPEELIYEIEQENKI